MRAIPLSQAKSKLVVAIGQLEPGDAIEAFGEVFVHQDVPASHREVVERIVERVNGTLEIEELLDLWNVVFPKDSGIFFDEQSNCICFFDKSEEVPLAE